MCSCDQSKTSTEACCGSCASGGACESSGACSSSSQTIINPKSVVPITSSEAASNKYSIETSIKSTSGTSQSSVRVGTGTGDVPADITKSVHAALLETVIEIIRSVIGDTYTSDAITGLMLISDGTLTGIMTTLSNGSTVAAYGPYLDTLANFQKYFNVGWIMGVDPLTDAQKAKVNYIAKAVYPLFLSIEKHNSLAETSTDVCASASSRVFQTQIKNCLFCLKFIYN